MGFQVQKNKLQFEVLKDRIIEDDAFRRNVIQDPVNLTKPVIEDILQMKERKKDQDHRKYIFFSHSGEGKSASALKLATVIDPKFQIGRGLYYSFSEALDNLKKVRRYSVLWMDERPNESGPGSCIEANEFNNLAEQCRDYDLSIIGCANTKHEYEYHYAFEAMFGFTDFDNNICRMVVHSPTTQKVIGYCDFGFVGESHPKLWKRYLTVKRRYGRRRMRKRGTGKWDERLKKITKFKVKGHHYYLLTELKDKYTNKNGEFKLPQRICVEVVDQVYPHWNRDIRAYELASKLYYAIKMGTI